MGKQYQELKPSDIEFIKAQKLFYIASCSDHEVNLSPKGYDTIRVLNSKQLLFMNYPGSGNRTYRDAQANGEFTLVFNAFEGAPNILRIFAKAKIVDQSDEAFESYCDMVNVRAKHVRDFFIFDIYAVESSCGMSVPIMEYKEERNELRNWVKDMASSERLDEYKQSHHTPPKLQS
jgi:peroxiredoxin family protein